MLVGGAEIVQGKNVRFYVSDEKIIVSTTLQAFVLEPAEPCWTRRLKTIKMLVLMGQINSINDIAEACVDHKQGTPRRIILWTPTRVPVTL